MTLRFTHIATAITLLRLNLPAVAQQLDDKGDSVKMSAITAKPDADKKAR